MAMIVREGKTTRGMKTRISGPEIFKVLGSGLAWKIARSIAKSPCYPSRIAKELGVHEQKVYYHIREMEKAGLIKVVKTEEKKGALAKYYGLKYDALSLILKESWEEITHAKETPELLEGFVSAGNADFLIVVGSPDPHGPYKARCLENAHLGDLASFIGTFCSSTDLITRLDTEIREKEKKENLILLGGPRVNMLTLEINGDLPLNFESETGDWAVKSEVSGKEYFGDEVGVVQKVPSPFNEEKSVLLFAGNRFSGSKSAVVAFVKHLKEIEKGNDFDRKVIAKVVTGHDLNGDGQIDEIEFLE